MLDIAFQIAGLCPRPNCWIDLTVVGHNELIGLIGFCPIRVKFCSNLDTHNLGLAFFRLDIIHC